MKKILLTGGGTAGHIWPIIALIEDLQKNPEVSVLYVGESNGQEKIIAKQKNIPYLGVSAGKWRRYFSFANFTDLFKTIMGLCQAFFVIRSFKPSVVFVKGGFVTIPIVFWSKFFHIPIIVHESDISMGRANRFAAARAKKICLGFPTKYYPKIPIEKAVYTGIPLNRAFFTETFQKNNRPTILITGGSQGSSKINNLFIEILPQILNKYEVYHLSGKRDFEKISKLSFDHKSNYHLYDFSFKMPELMKKADLIISRAGANTLAEISALAKASILIPLPTASGNHQAINASIYADSSAAVVCSENDLTPSSLLDTINRLMDDHNKRKLLGQMAKRFSFPESTSLIIKIILENTKDE